VQIDQRKLDRARRALLARTETETLDRALDLVVTAADISSRRCIGTRAQRSTRNVRAPSSEGLDVRT